MNTKKISVTRKCNCCRESFFPPGNSSLKKFCSKYQRCKDADKEWALKERQKKNDRAKNQKKHILKRTPLNKISKKRIAQNKEYEILRKKFIKDNPKCELCPKSTKDLHHKNGRNGSRLTDPVYFMAVCRSHHEFIHLNPEESRKNGWLI